MREIARLEDLSGSDVLFPDAGLRTFHNGSCQLLSVRNDCPVYTFFFVFPLISLSNPHSFITTSYIPIYSYFPSPTACLYVQYSAH